MMSDGAMEYKGDDMRQIAEEADRKYEEVNSSSKNSSFTIGHSYHHVSLLS